MATKSPPCHFMEFGSLFTPPLFIFPVFIMQDSLVRPALLQFSLFPFTFVDWHMSWQLAASPTFASLSGCTVNAQVLSPDAPSQFLLDVSSSLPTPCRQMSVIVALKGCTPFPVPDSVTPIVEPEISPSPILPERQSISFGTVAARTACLRRLGT